MLIYYFYYKHELLSLIYKYNDNIYLCKYVYYV